MIVPRRIVIRWFTVLPTALGCLATALIAGGCGGSGGEVESGLVPVKGRVTLDGGPWPRPGSVSFIPKAAPEAKITGIGTFDTSGNFNDVIGGYGGAKGLHPGVYWASVQCAEVGDEMPLPGKKSETKDYVPQKYKDPSTSGFTLEVQAGKPAEVAYDVKTK